MPLRVGALGRRRGHGGRDQPVRRLRALRTDLRGAGDHTAARGGGRPRAARAGGVMTRPSSPTSALGTLTSLGQSVWLDYIHREMLESGELKRLIERRAVRGVT